MEIADQNPTLRWQWLPLGYRASGAGRQAVGNLATLNKVFDLILSRILPPECFTSQQLVDINGGELNELLAIHGEIRKISEDDEEEWLPFSVSLKTEFKGFEGSHHIIHSLRWGRSEELDAQFSVRGLSVNEDVRLNKIQVYLAYFESRFASIFGYAPMATRQLEIEANLQELQWQGLIEGVRGRAEAVQIFNALCAPIEKIAQEIKS